MNNLVYLNNRHYDPTTGVFLSVDPLVSKTGEPYIYASANPVAYSDPTGLCGCEFFGGDQSEYTYRPTAMDTFVDSLWGAWASSETFSDFVDTVALDYSGIDLGTLPFPGSRRLPWEDPTTRLPDRPGKEILGESGWRVDLVDGDLSPARHFFGFFAIAWSNGPFAATWALEDNEAPDLQGSSLQDLNSGYAAIALARPYSMFGTPDTNDQFAQFIGDLRAVAGDPFRVLVPCCDSRFDSFRIPSSARGGDGGFIIRQQQQFLIWPDW